MAIKTAKWRGFLLLLRPEAKLEAAIETGRVILPQKSPKNLIEAATASKRSRRHFVGSWSQANLQYLTPFWKFFHLNG